MNIMDFYKENKVIIIDFIKYIKTDFPNVNPENLLKEQFVVQIGYLISYLQYKNFWIVATPNEYAICTTIVNMRFEYLNGIPYPNCMYIKINKDLPLNNFYNALQKTFEYIDVPF